MNAAEHEVEAVTPAGSDVYHTEAGADKLEGVLELKDTQLELDRQYTPNAVTLVATPPQP